MAALHGRVWPLSLVPVTENNLIARIHHEAVGFTVVPLGGTDDTLEDGEMFR